MPYTTTQTVEVASGGEDCCCEGGCLLCGRSDYPYTLHPPSPLHFLESFTNTITASTGDVSHWFSENGITFPASLPIPYVLESSEFCGFAGTLSITAYCCNDLVCISYVATFMLFGDCVTFTTPACGVSDTACGECDPTASTSAGQFGWGVATIVMGEEVCDDDGFVSVDYVITLAFGEGTISGTISR